MDHPHRRLREVELTDRLPRTADGKIRRAELREQESKAGNSARGLASQPMNLPTAAERLTPGGVRIRLLFQEAQ